MGGFGGDIIDDAVNHVKAKTATTPHAQSLDQTRALLFGDSKKKGQSNPTNQTGSESGSNSSGNGSDNFPNTQQIDPAYAATIAKNKAAFDAFNNSRQLNPSQNLRLPTPTEADQFAKSQKTPVVVETQQQQDAADARIGANEKAQDYAEAAQRALEEKQNPGSWSNAFPQLVHAVGQFGANAAKFGANASRDIAGLFPGTESSAAQPLYKDTSHIDPETGKYVESSELTPYGQQVNSGQKKDPLGQFIIGMDAYQSETNKSDQQNPLPHTFLGNTASGAIHIAPDIATVSLLPEAEGGELAAGSKSLLTRLSDAATNPFTKLQAVKGAASGYNEAKQTGQSGVIGGIEGGAEGETSGTSMMLLGNIAGDIVSPKIASALKVTGLIKSGKYTKMGADMLADATVFGAYPIASNLIQGKPIDWNEVQSGVGTGLGFGLMKAKETASTHGEIEDQVKKTLKDAQGVALQNFINASPDAIAQAYQMPDNSGELTAKAVDYARQTMQETDLNKKKQLAAASSTFSKAAGIKATTEAIITDPHGFVKNIQDAALPDDVKQQLLQKAVQVNQQLSPDERAKNSSASAIHDLNQQIDANQQLVDNPATDPITKIKAQAALDALTKQKELHEGNMQAIISNQMNGVATELPKPTGEPEPIQVVEPVPSDTETKTQNDATDEKVRAFQEKFPDHKVDPLSDLPESVVRTFDRVDADIPTDHIALNEASDWLYNKYKELSAMKLSDTRMLTIPQIEEYQAQLGEDITTLENHKLKYHGDEEAQAQEIKPAEPLIDEPVGVTGTGDQSERGTTGNAQAGEPGIGTSTIKVKEEDNHAIQKQQPNEVGVREQGTLGGQMGKGNAGHQEPTGESSAKNEAAQVQGDGKENPKTPVDGGTLRVEPKDAKTVFVPTNSIKTDTERFQPRGSDFSKASTDKIVNNYDDNKLDPIVIYKDANGKDYVLAGHSRLEAHKQLDALPDDSPVKQKSIENGYEPGQIKARYFDGTEEQAKEFADRSNDLGNKNTDYESAASIRKMRKSGATQKEIDERAEQDFGKDAAYIKALSYLNPKGEVINALKQLGESGDKATRTQLEKIAQWIGEARRRLPELTDSHEREMFNFLNDKKNDNITTKADFVSKIASLVNNLHFDAKEPLNLNRVKNINQGEDQYNHEYAELKAKVESKQREIDNLNDRFNNPKNPDYLKPTDPDYEAMVKYAEKLKVKKTEELKSLRADLLELAQKKGQYAAEGVSQKGLFDVPLKPEEIAQGNEDLKTLNIPITINDIIKDIQNEHTDTEQPGDSSEPAVIEANAEAVQQPKDEPGTDAGEVTGDQGQAGSAGISDKTDAERLAEIDDELKKPTLETYDAQGNRGLDNKGGISSVDKAKLEKERGDILNRNPIPEEPIKISDKETAIRQQITNATKELDDFIKKATKNTYSFAGAVGAGGELVVRAAKVMAAYSKLGIYKFGQMLDSMRHQFGDDFVNQNIDGLRKAYAITRDDASDDEIDKFDNEKSVRQHIADNAATIAGKEKETPVEPEIKPEPRDEMADLKTAFNKKRSLEKQTGDDALLKEFAGIDPRYLTPDEVARYNELTKDKSATQLHRDDIAKFIDDVHGRQDDENEAREKEWYKQLADDPDFEDENIKKVLKDVGEIEGNETDLENTKENNTAKSALKKLLNYGRGELKDVEPPAGFEGAKKAMLSIDEDKLSTRDLRDMNRAIEGMINDGNFAGSGKWVALDESVKKAADILDAKNKRGLESGQTRKLPGELRSLPQNIEIIVKDSKLASTVQEKSGIFDISAGNAKVNKTMNNITKEFSKLTDKMGKDISSTENRYKRGILATFLQQAETDSPEDHFNRYKGYIEQTAKKLLKSSKKAEQREGELVQSLYDKHIKDAKTSDDIVKSLTKDNPDNLKIVNFFIDKQKEVYPTLRQSALMYSGKELPLIENYTSTQMKRLRGADEKQMSAQMITDPASMDSDDNPTNTGQSRTTISRRKGMRPDRVLNLNFDGMQLNRLRESHYDVQTLPARYLYEAIRKQPDFKEALGNSQKNVNVISDGVSTMVKAQLGFNHTDPVAKMVLDTMNMIGTAGTRIALKGIDQFAKHYPSRAINTLGNLGSDIGLYFKAMAKIGTGHQPIFNESGIGLRGLSKGGTDIEGSIRQFQKYDFSTAGEWLNAIHKVFNKADGILSAPLTVSDELVAKHSWAAYYMQDLQRRGVDIDNIDFNTEHEHMDKEAAAYAEQMVSRNEIPNDPTQRAIFDQRGDVASAKDLFAEMGKKLAFPFTTYSRNIQVRLENDIRKFNGGNRKEAARSIVSTMAETAAFQSIKILLKIASGAAAGYALTQFGFNAQKHDTKKDWKQLPSQTFDDMFLAGLGSTVDGGIKDGINNIYKLAKGNQSDYIFKNYDPGQFGETNFGLAGMYGILPQKIHEATQEFSYAKGKVDGEADAYSPYFGPYKQQYESQLTDKQKELAQAVFAVDILGIAGMSGATTQRLNTAIFNQIKMQKEPVRFHSGMEHNKKSGSIKGGGKIKEGD